MSRRRRPDRPMWRFENESDKSAVAIPYKVLYENGRRKYGTPPSMVILPEYLIGAEPNVILEYLELEVEYHYSQ